MLVPLRLAIRGPHGPLASAPVPRSPFIAAARSLRRSLRGASADAGTVTAAPQPHQLMERATRIMQQGPGGEGAELIKANRESGYWNVSLFTVQGRPLPFWPMATYSAYATLFIAIMETFFTHDILLDPVNARTFAGVQLAMTLVGSALFFLLTFRVNNATSRYWEGSGLLGSVRTSLITVCRGVSGGHMPSQQLAQQLMRWAMAYLITLKSSLRGDEPDMEAQALGQVLAPSELLEVQGIPPRHRVPFTIQKLQQVAVLAQKEKLMGSCMQKELEKVIPDLTTAMVNMQRIVNTPMPFAYITHLRTFLVLWLAVLPLVFVYFLQYFALVPCLTIATILLGMDSFSLEIECPFGRDHSDLPIDSLCANIMQSLLLAYESTSQLPLTGHDNGVSDLDTYLK